MTNDKRFHLYGGTLWERCIYAVEKLSKYIRKK